MKPLILSLVFLLAAPFVSAQDKDPYHTFRADDGRTMRAVIVRTGPDDVWIRRDDGQTFRVAVSSFSETDRRFISEWERMNALKAPNALEFSARRFSDGRETEIGRTNRTTVERFGYIVTLTNRTSLDLENLEIEYRCFVMRGGVGETRQARSLERFSGTSRIKKLSPRETQEFKTEPVALRTVSRRGGSVFSNRENPNSNQRRTNDDLGGIWIRIRQGNQTIAEFSAPVKLMESESW